jgi:hypothetical protein
MFFIWTSLDFRLERSLIQAMKLTEKQIQRLVHLVFAEMENQKILTYKAKPHEAAERAAQIVRGDFKREIDLEHEVNRMMEDLERQNPGEFQRYKMFPLLKKRLAKEKGIIL